MLTRFVRIQLILFTIASVVGVSVMMFTYMQLPTLFGLGRTTVTLQMPDTGALYRFSNVTYRGVQIGKVTDIRLTRTGAEATLSLDESPQVPADLRAEVRSVSAVGEQYVELLPNTDSGPYLQTGDVITMTEDDVPQAVGPMLDQLNKLVSGIPKDQLSQLLDESFQAFNGAGYDFQSLIDSASTITNDANSVSDQTVALIEDAGPLLDGAAESADATRLWAASLAGVTEQLRINDPQIRTVLQTGPGLADEVSALLTQVQPTLPILLANLVSVGQVAVTYHASIEQLLVLLPPYIAAQQAYGLGFKNPSGLPHGDFTLQLGDPSVCTVGFLPPSSWRSPADVTTIDTPDGLYCKLPQDAPMVVRGARNYPCMEHPGKRAPTVELCNDPRGYVPLAERQHSIGPYQLDPNLVSQGIPPDTRYVPDSQIYGPVGGTPLPPGAVPAGTPPDGVAPPPTVPEPAVESVIPDSILDPPVPNEVAPTAPPLPEVGPLPPAEVAPAPAPAAVPTPQAAPAGLETSPGPSVAFAQYDPQTGQYVSPTGQSFTQSNLVAPGDHRTWQDMMLG